MKPVSELRLDNLELLVREFGTLEAVANRAGTSSVYLSQIRNGTIDQKTGRPRHMGGVMARRLEEGCAKPPGWMDTAHAPSDPLLPGEEEDFGGRGGNVVAVPVVGAADVDQTDFYIDPELASGFVLGAGVHDGYAVKVVGTGGARALRDGQYMVFERDGNPFFNDFFLYRVEAGAERLVEVLGSHRDRVNLEEVATGRRFTVDEEDIRSKDCVVAVVSASRWRPEAPDPATGLRPRKKRIA